MTKLTRLLTIKLVLTILNICFMNINIDKQKFIIISAIISVFILILLLTVAKSVKAANRSKLLYNEVHELKKAKNKEIELTRDLILVERAENEAMKKQADKKKVSVNEDTTTEKNEADNKEN